MRFKSVENVAQGHTLIGAAGKTTGVELGIHVGIGQPEVIELEDARDGALHQPQRVDICDLVATQAVHLDHSRHRSLFAIRGGLATR